MLIVLIDQICKMPRVSLLTMQLLLQSSVIVVRSSGASSPVSFVVTITRPLCEKKAELFAYTSVCNRIHLTVYRKTIDHHPLLFVDRRFHSTLACTQQLWRSGCRSLLRPNRRPGCLGVGLLLVLQNCVASTHFGVS